jgi:hypothetical protein
MKQTQYGEYRMSLLDRRGDQRCTIAGRPGSASTAAPSLLWSRPLWISAVGVAECDFHGTCATSPA